MPGVRGRRRVCFRENGGVCAEQGARAFLPVETLTKNPPPPFLSSLLAMGVDAVPPDFTFWGMIAALLAAGVIDVAQAGAGFANASSLSILALYAVSAGVEQTGALDSVVARVLGRTRSAPFALARMVLPVAAASGFLSNLAVVSLLVRKVMGKKKTPNQPLPFLLCPGALFHPSHLPRRPLTP